MTGKPSPAWGYALGLFNTTVAPIVAAGVCSAADVPPTAPAGVAAAVGAGILARRWLTRSEWTRVTPWSEAAFKAAAAMSAGAWATWSTLSGPWHVPNLAVGVAAAVIGGLVAPAFLTDTPSPLTPGERLLAASGDPRAVEWKARIERICRVQPVTVTAVDDWPNGAGYTLRLRFAPESGDTWQSVVQHVLRLAGAMYLPTGCVIGVSEGDRQGTATVRVPTVNALGADVWMTDEVAPTSIWDDQCVAVNDDTSDAVVNLRQEAGLVVSMRGGGKTNLLNRIICRLLECEDNLTWIVDLNGGGLAVPFMMPFVDGLVARPPIDWIAYDEAEALSMARVASAIARDRKARYARLKARTNTDLLPVNRHLPQITIVIDESAEVEERAPKAMKALLEVQRIGRAEAVNVVFSALRGTQDTIPVPVRKQAVLKICGVVESDSELEYVLPNARVRSADLVHPGTMYMTRGKDVRQVKVHRTSPQLIAAVVEGTEPWWPTLDEPGRQAGGDRYEGRMQRLEPWLAVLRGDAPPPDADAAVTADPTGAASATASDRDAARERARANLRRFVAVEAVRDEIKGMPTQRLDAEFDRIVADVRVQQSGPEQDSGDWSPEMLLRIVADNPQVTPTGMQKILAERGIQVSDKTLHKWLNRYVGEGRLRRDDGRYTT
jgi:S-DNA-T family DNA segregation ATPase FtsK/SpoIIIE